jgi:hypothetical protein
VINGSNTAVRNRPFRSLNRKIGRRYRGLLLKEAMEVATSAIPAMSAKHRQKNIKK